MDEEIYQSWAELWRPPERLPLSEWAEKNFILSEYSAKTGRLRLRGYQREPFDCFTDPRVTEIVLEVGTQMLKTLFLQVALAYLVIEDPGPALMSQPKEDDARQFSLERLATMIRDIPALNVRIGESKERTSSNTALFKTFPGGSLSVVGAGAPGNAARRSIRYYFADEVNKYEPTSEGPFTALADERTSTFRHRAKRVYCCSPTTPDAEISRRFDSSDQRLPFVACGTCGEWQTLKWAQVRIDHDAPLEDQAESARYICEYCGAVWSDVDRWQATERIQWVAQKPFRGIAGFGGLGHLYSPDKTLAQMWRTFAVASVASKQGDNSGLQVFVNTNLAERWIERGEAPEWQRLYERAESYRLRSVPDGGLFVTAGGDVQKDRIEVQCVAWGRGKRSWLVDYTVLDGDTSRPEVWAKLDEFLGTTYRGDAGVELPIARIAIDSGYATQEVYQWARRHGTGRVMVVKGYDGGAAIVGTPSPVDVRGDGRKVKRGVKVWPVNASALKSELYGWLGLERPTAEAMEAGAEYPPGYCHFPQMGEEFFRQMTAEQLVTRRVKGYTRQEWTKTRDRNEALDTRVYARAAASQYGMDRFGETQWRAHEINFADARTSAPLPPTQAATEVIRQQPKPVTLPGVPAAVSSPRGESYFGTRWKGFSQ